MTLGTNLWWLTCWAGTDGIPGEIFYTWKISEKQQISDETTEEKLKAHPGFGTLFFLGFFSSRIPPSCFLRRFFITRSSPSFIFYTREQNIWLINMVQKQLQTYLIISCAQSACVLLHYVFLPWSDYPRCLHFLPQSPMLLWTAACPCWCRSLRVLWWAKPVPARRTEAGREV